MSSSHFNCTRDFFSLLLVSSSVCFLSVSRSLRLSDILVLIRTTTIIFLPFDCVPRKCSLYASVTFFRAPFLSLVYLSFLFVERWKLPLSAFAHTHTHVLGLFLDKQRVGRVNVIKVIPFISVFSFNIRCACVFVCVWFGKKITNCACICRTSDEELRSHFETFITIFFDVCSLFFSF